MPLVLNPFGDLTHQFVVIDSIEELLQIKINTPAVTRRYIAAPVPLPDELTALAENRSCVGRTSNPIASAEPALPLAG